MINRRFLLAPPLPMTKVNGMKKMEKNRSPALDIGSHINACGKSRSIAAATEERKLSGVGFSAWLGPA
jgi:hypothetical protein